MIPRPPRLLPVVEYRQEPDPKEWEHGYQFIAEQFAQKEAEIKRLNGHLAMLREMIDGNCVDKKNGKG